VNRKISLEDQSFETMCSTYQGAGARLQASFDEFINEMDSMVLNGSIEGPAAVTLQELASNLKQTIQLKIEGFTHKRGVITYDAFYTLKHYIDI